MKKRKTYFWGLLLVACAGIMFGEMFNLLPTNINVFSVIITTVLIGMSLSSIPRVDFFGIIMPLGFALIFNRSSLNLDGNSWQIFWASLILSIGLSLIFKKNKKNKFHVNVNYGSSDKYDTKREDKDYVDVDYVEYDAEDNPKRNYYNEDESVSISNNLGDKSHYLHSEGLKYANIENNLGSLNVYFDHVVFMDGCKIYVDNNLGSTTLYLPREHRYFVDIDNFLGSSDNKANFTAESGITITIKGSVSLGELDIRYI